MHRIHLITMTVLAILVSYLNRDALGMAGLLPNYLMQKEIILHNFDAAHSPTPAFPMWGYAWLMLLTENHAVLIAIQQALAILALCALVFVMTRCQLLEPVFLGVFRWLLALSLPWYALHALRWANSPAVSFFVLSLTALLYALHTGRRGAWVLSGLLWGVSLNFRSDFYVLPLVFAALILAYRGREVAPRVAVWLGTLLLCMVPWLAYTSHTIGHAQFTSTNGGHVWFIGLGLLPGNTWGITPYDGDPLMHALIREEFGEPKPSTGYEASGFLMDEFTARVQAEPAEYARKVVYSVVMHSFEGTYPGEFSKSGAPALEVLTGIMGSRVVLLSLLALPFTLWFERRNLAFVLVATAVLYQVAVSAFAYHMTSYTSNVYALHVVNLVYALAGCVRAVTLYRRVRRARVG